MPSKPVAQNLRDRHVSPVANAILVAAAVGIALAFALMLTLFATSGSRVETAAREDSFVIHNVTLIDGSGRPPVPDTTVVVDVGRIVYVGPAQQRPRAAARDGETRTIEGRGKFLIPALIDTHAHVTYLDWVRDASGNSTAVYNDAISQETLQLLLKYGITTGRNPAGPTKAATTLRDRIARGEIRGPRLLTAGNTLNRVPRFDGLTRPVDSGADIEREIAAQAAPDARVDYVKIYANLPPRW